MERTQSFEFAQDASRNDLGGRSFVSPSTTIVWRSEYLTDSEGASPVAVLEAVAQRLTQLQKTPQACDANARALWELQKSIDLLNGRSINSGSVLGDAK